MERARRGQATPRDDRDDLRLSHFPWLLEPEAWHLGRAWVDRDLHRYREHYSLPARCLGPRGGRVSPHDLATRFSDEGRAVPRRFILSAQAGSDASGAGDNTELRLDSLALLVVADEVIE